MMKYVISLLLALFNIFFVAGQITASGGKSYRDYNGIDYIFVFNGIDSETSLSYQDVSGASVEWYKFTEDAPSPALITNQADNYNISDMTGYLLVVNGTVKITAWVIDYKNYLPVFNAFMPENNPAVQCSEVSLFPDADIKSLYYLAFDKDRNWVSGKREIHRFFNISYNNIEWKDKEWMPKEEKTEIALPRDQLDTIKVKAPLVETAFTISGDQFAVDLGLNPLPSVTSDLYTPVAVECHLLYTTAVREELHEGKRPDADDVVDGSSPLVIDFQAKANEPVASYFKWEISKDGVPVVSRTDKEHSYTFTNAGVYKVLLTVNSSMCSTTDTLLVTVTTSDLQVPYVFTPNGDGKNDEFRVAYTSLTQFKCWIFNRWGRQIYVWTDPQKGWDGTISGTPAKPGGYIYIIEATGADIDESTKKPVKYRRKGIINLLR